MFLRGFSWTNDKINDYLREKIAIGFVVSASVHTRYKSDLSYCTHQFRTLPAYFDKIISPELARICCAGDLIPCNMDVPNTSEGKPPQEQLWIIRTYPYSSLVVPLTNDHAPLVAEHLRSVRDVLWKPGEET